MIGWLVLMCFCGGMSCSLVVCVWPTRDRPAALKGVIYPHPEYPEQFNTGREGYFANCLSSKCLSHLIKKDPLPDFSNL